MFAGWKPLGGVFVELYHLYFHAHLFLWIQGVDLDRLIYFDNGFLRIYFNSLDITLN